MITGTNESKTLRNHISCECKSKFDGRKYNANQKRNNAQCRCQCKNPKSIVCAKRLYLESYYM